MYWHEVPTKCSRYVYAIGSNANSARQVGIPTRRNLTHTYVICSSFAALGALLFLGRAPYAKSDYSVTWELDAIAAVVIGGTSLFGGRGTLWGTFMGVILLKIINNGLTLAQLNTFWQMVVTGLIILLAIALDIVRQSRDPLLIEKFFLGLAAAMAFLAFLLPGGQWITAKLALLQHAWSQAQNAAGATLAPGHVARILPQGQLEEVLVQAASSAVPAMAMFTILGLSLAAFLAGRWRFTFAVSTGLALVAVTSLFSEWSEVFPFVLLGTLFSIAGLSVPYFTQRISGFGRHSA